MNFPQPVMINDALAGLLNTARSRLAANPPTSEKPFWKIEFGSPSVDSVPRPTMNLGPVHFTHSANVDGNPLLEMKVVTTLLADRFEQPPDINNLVDAAERFFTNLVEQPPERMSMTGTRKWKINNANRRGQPDSAEAQITLLLVYDHQNGLRTT